MKAGQYENILDAIRWGNDYLIKCIGDGKSEIVVQVNSGVEDHKTWGHPEDLKGPLPVYTVSPKAPGSDVVGAMAAALAAASKVFAEEDAAYSKELLAAAIKAYK